MTPEEKIKEALTQLQTLASFLDNLVAPIECEDLLEDESGAIPIIGCCQEIAKAGVSLRQAMNWRKHGLK